MPRQWPASRSKPRWVARHGSEAVKLLGNSEYHIVGREIKSLDGSEDIVTVQAVGCKISVVRNVPMGELVEVKYGR